jgi:serine/threonine protein kinase/class 3 adenylate cyclase/uncharacterized protein HemY
MSTPTRPEDLPSQTVPDTVTPGRSDQTGSTSEFPTPPIPGAERELAGSFGRYTILCRLGKGGMGRVYLAHDPHLDRQIALKVPQFGVGEPEMLRERFYREARAAASLNHPNICSIYEVGEVGDTPYLTMAYVEGQPLGDWALVAPRPLSEILRIIRKIALAIHEAHAIGVIHRDLKPSNVLIDQRGEPIVMDFGLARRQLGEETRLTSPGVVMGTPAYMPPEAVHARGESSPASDIWSLGVILYELLAGRCPFVGPPTAVLVAIVSNPVEPPSRHRRDLDPRVDAICLKALTRDPHRRFRSMAEFANALAEVPSPASTTIVGHRAIKSGEASISQKQPPDERLAERILDLMRKWGVGRGLQKIRNKVESTDHFARRQVWQGFLDWMAGKHTDEARTAESYQSLPCGRALRGWALAGQASHLISDRDLTAALKLLDKAEMQGDPEDRVLQAAIAHTRATALVHAGKSDIAIPFLHAALDRFGREHFMTGRVLDTLGMAYSYKGNFPVAREFFEQSIRYKQNKEDDFGIAISHGQLGRLYLAWGHLDQAEEHFQEDLRLVQRLRSRWGEGQVYNHLGQVALARGEREAGAGRRATARRHFVVAAGWLDQSIRHAQENSYPISEAFGRKDRALLLLHQDDLDRAEEEARQARETFTANHFAEGVAKVHLVEGKILRRRERWQEAERKFRLALEHFENTQEIAETIHAYWEIARTHRDSGAPAPLVTRAYIDTLRRAEAARLDPLVRDVEQELHEVDVESYLRHIYRRARGFGIDEDSPSLMEGTSETATVLFVDLPGFSTYSHGLDEEAVLVTFNHLMADFAGVLARYQGRMIAYRGNGLMALVRSSSHAERGVSAALDLVEALEEFNRPRAMLGLKCFHVRIGIASGDLLLGNVGTYLKMDFSAIGATVNLAGALRNEAQPGLPCVSRGTYELVRDRFTCKEESPRSVQVAGFGPVEVWDVVGRKETPRR